MARYDLPATVDYILRATSAKQLIYIGHSQGGEIAFAALSENPDLQSKVKAFVALAPAVYLGHMTSPLKYLVPLEGSIEVIGNFFFFFSFLSNNDSCNNRLPL